MHLPCIRNYCHYSAVNKYYNRHSIVHSEGTRRRYVRIQQLFHNVLAVLLRPFTKVKTCIDFFGLARHSACHKNQLLLHQKQCTHMHAFFLSVAKALCSPLVCKSCSITTCMHMSSPLHTKFRDIHADAREIQHQLAGYS